MWTFVTTPRKEVLPSMRTVRGSPSQSELPPMSCEKRLLPVSRSRTSSK